MQTRSNKTYYDRPLLKKPHWEWNVVTYLFLGGIMGGSGMLGAIAQRSGDAELQRSSRYISIALAFACPAVLISHLGRPERFLNMMRIVKLKSPMSMGVWGLVGYSAFAGMNAAAQLSRDGVLPKWIARFEPAPVAVPMQALFGAFTAGYTGVLLSATAIPLWGKGKVHIPAMSVCSAVAGACAVNAIALSANPRAARTLHKLEKLEAVASAAELAILLHFRMYAGSTGKPMYEGQRGQRLTTLTIGAGIAAPLLLNAPSLLSRGEKKLSFLSTIVTVAAGAATLLGGYILRETLIEAGKVSTDDPREAFFQPK